MKKMEKITILVLIVVLLTSCSKETNKQEKFNYTFYDTFDTVTEIIAYTNSEEEFNRYMETAHNRFKELHKLYDKYNEYDGLNNIKTINDNAGIKPVKVQDEIFDMIEFSLEWYEKTGGETNIALGPVVDIWKEYTEKALEDPKKASIPSMDDLQKAAKYTDIDKIILNKEEKTVFLEDKNMSLDVGSVAKGYATEIVASELERDGLKSAIISAGGNIRTIGKPVERDREKWGVGIQNPDENLIKVGNLLDTVYTTDMSVVSSGDYQRYYFVDNKRIHHIIDPKTLMPGDYYRAVTIVTPHSGLADFLSTSIFLLPYEESKKLVESLDDVEALWVFKNGDIKFTDGMKNLLASQGAKNK